MLIDTHVHIPLMIDMRSRTLTASEYGLIADIVRISGEQEVNRMITIGTTVHDSAQNVTIASRFPELYATIGIHPTEITATWRDELALFARMLEGDEQRRIVGVGECGIDRYHTGEGSASVALQQDVFRAQIELALKYDLSLVVHSRHAFDETVACLDEFRDSNLRGVIHCFSYDLSSARESITRNFVLGIGGAITYPKNEMLREVVCSVPMSALIFETDAPFLPPQPWRGKKNHPQYIAYLADYCATVCAVSREVIVHTTTMNVKRIFNHISIYKETSCE